MVVVQKMQFGFVEYYQTTSNNAWPKTSQEGHGNSQPIIMVDSIRWPLTFNPCFGSPFSLSEMSRLLVSCPFLFKLQSMGAEIIVFGTVDQKMDPCLYRCTVFRAQWWWESIVLWGHLVPDDEKKA